MSINEAIGVLAENMAIDLNLDEEFALKIVCYLFSEDAVNGTSLFNYLMKESALVERAEAAYEGWGGTRGYDTDDT